MDWDKSKNLKLKIREVFLHIEEVLYYIVAIGLIIGFIVVIIDGFTILISLYETSNFYEGAIKFLDKILVSLIFVEIFYTVSVAITEESALKCVEPFILVAVTALVRRLLTLSFEISHPTEFSPERMKFFLYEMALVGILILLLVFSIIIFRRSKR